MLELTTGDTAPGLTGVCSNKTGGITTPVDLTGAAVAIHIQRADKTVLTKTATITDADSGAWSATWSVGDLNTDGTYKAEAQVTYAGGLIQTFGPVSFKVVKQLG